MLRDAGQENWDEPHDKASKMAHSGLEIEYRDAIQLEPLIVIVHARVLWFWLKAPNCTNYVPIKHQMQRCMHANYVRVKPERLTQILTTECTRRKYASPANDERI